LLSATDDLVDELDQVIWQANRDLLAHTRMVPVRDASRAGSVPLSFGDEHPERRRDAPRPIRGREKPGNSDRAMR
jgi:hypothetical protein